MFNLLLWKSVQGNSRSKRLTWQKKKKKNKKRSLIMLTDTTTEAAKSVEAAWANFTITSGPAYLIGTFNPLSSLSG